MAKTRVHELAKQLEVANKDILTFLEKNGIEGKTHSSGLEDDLVKRIKDTLSKKTAPVTTKPQADKPSAPATHAKAEKPSAPQIHIEKPVIEKRQPFIHKPPYGPRPTPAQPQTPATPATSAPSPASPAQGQAPSSTPPQGSQPQRPSGYQGTRPTTGYQPQRPAGTGYQGTRPAGGGYQGQRPGGAPGGAPRPAGSGYQGQRPGGAPGGAPRPAGGGYQGGQRPGGGPGGQRPSGPPRPGSFQGQRPGGYQNQRPQVQSPSQYKAEITPPANFTIKKDKPRYEPPSIGDVVITVADVLKQPLLITPVVTSLPEEETLASVPDKFRKTIEADKVEKFKAKPGMQKAFQAIRKIDQKKWNDPRAGRKGFRDARYGGRADSKTPLTTAPRKKVIKLIEGATVKEFAELISVKLSDIMKKFMEMGFTPNLNQPVDMDAALLVAEIFGVKVEIAQAEDLVTEEDQIIDEAAHMLHRPPVVTIMGHVDHGKTSLLDAIRETKVIETEAGGITQHIGAYKVSLKGKEIVFLDTPGHEAFTALRARGAKVTDIVILVVAADDGIKPQTIEAIDHAKAAGVPIMVAINKIDKPEADVQKVKTELMSHEVVPEEWGGKNVCVEISAKKRIGIENLLELILLQAEMMELKANPDRHARGVIIEARLDKGKGPVATVLVQNGTLHTGDVFLSGTNAGRVRVLHDDAGKRIESAGPSTPVEVMGFSAVPTAGDMFLTMDDERRAKQIAIARELKQRASETYKKRKLTLDELYSKIKEGDIKDLNIIIKGDVQGSVEALRESMEAITHAEVKVQVIHSAIGGINESDVMLAAASNAIIIGFNVRPDSKAAQIADKEGVDIELYNIIYEAIDDVKKALEGMLEPTIKETVLGRAEVRQIYEVSRLGTIAGSMVLDGVIRRASDGVRLIRDSVVIYTGRIGSLKRFKEDTREVATGYECGIMIENYSDVKVGDIIENFIIEKVASKL